MDRKIGISTDFAFCSNVKAGYSFHKFIYNKFNLTNYKVDNMCIELLLDIKKLTISNIKKSLVRPFVHF